MGMYEKIRQDIPQSSPQLMHNIHDLDNNSLVVHNAPRENITHTTHIVKKAAGELCMN